MPVRIFAINQAGFESGFDALDASRTLPWLQDTQAVNAWDAWAVVYRDVVMLGTDNARHGIYNLTEHDLAETANYAALRDALRKASEDAAP